MQIIPEMEDEQEGKDANLESKDQTLMGMEKRWIRKDI